MNEKHNGATFRGPWWVTIVERTGALGILVLMLFGSFWIVRDYTNDMRKVWTDIHLMLKVSATEEAESRKGIQTFLDTFARTIGQRLDAIESRMLFLEEKRRQQNDVRTDPVGGPDCRLSPPRHRYPCAVCGSSRNGSAIPIGNQLAMGIFP